MQKKLEQWQLISSESIDVPVEEVSLVEYEPPKWFEANIPGTVVGHLVDAGLYQDPYYGINMKSIPGFKHGKTDHFAFHQMPADSPFRKSFWYRTIEKVDRQLKGNRIRLKIDGINYRANLWINGQRAAGDNFLIGAYNQYDIDITNFIKYGKENCIAIELFAQKPDELGITFIDWGPVPPDDSMGMWQPVTLYSTNEISISDLYIKGKPIENDKAEIEAFVEIRNESNISKDVLVRLTCENIKIEKSYTLPAKYISSINFTPDKYSELVIDNPRLWWPHDMGSPELYNARLELILDDTIIDNHNVTFGIRDITSHINEHNTRIFEINGKPILIRGAAWCPDLMLRQSDVQDRIDIAYVKNMNFNTIRFEGKFGSDYFWEQCDKEGILVLAGWPCCTHWEKWDEWKSGDLEVALECLKSQLKRLRNHPSLIAWFYGSDFPPPVNIEREYLKILSKYCNNISAISSASAYPSAVQGETGVKMSGPYGYVPPDYWYKENMPGKADSFNTEAGPDVTIPKIESLKKFIPQEELYIGSEAWNFHCGLASFLDTSISDNAINARYGEIKDLNDHNRKAQVLSYEVWRAAFESYGATFPVGGGFIGWMLNSGWPSMIWQLYDYYNKPIGGFYGAKKACEPIHVQYDYVKRTIKLCNYVKNISTPIEINISTYNLSSHKISENTIKKDVPSYGSVEISKLPKFDELVFLFIEWIHEEKRNYNCYWIPFKEDIYEDRNSRESWFTWPLKQHADLSLLDTLPICNVNYKTEFNKCDDEIKLIVNLENQSNTIAFFIEVEMMNDQVALWSDNCITLKPYEKRSIEGTVRKVLNENTFIIEDVKLSAWNCTFKKEH